MVSICRAKGRPSGFDRLRLHGHHEHSSTRWGHCLRGMACDMSLPGKQEAHSSCLAWLTWLACAGGDSGSAAGCQGEGSGVHGSGAGECARQEDPCMQGHEKPTLPSSNAPRALLLPPPVPCLRHPFTASNHAHHAQPSPPSLEAACLA